MNTVLVSLSGIDKHIVHQAQAELILDGGEPFLDDVGIVNGRVKSSRTLRTDDEWSGMEGTLESLVRRGKS